MDQRNPLFWAFNIGTWFGVRIRVSIFFPLAMCWFLYRFGVSLGSAISGLLFVSVLLHEFAHVLASRYLGGNGDEIVVWPLGGMALVDQGSSARTLAVTAAAGPAVNFLVCLMCVPALVLAHQLPGVFNPFRFPLASSDFGGSLGLDLQVVLFYLNWVMLLVNLIPAYPLDGGQVLHGWLTERLGRSLADELSLKIACGTGFVLALAGIFSDQTILLSIAMLIVVLALLGLQKMRSGETGDDSFLGYDFSQGYTSLEKTQPKPEVKTTRKPSFYQRWQERRKLERERRETVARQQAEEQLDALLAKVHERGIGALTESEKRLLKQASERFRDQGDRS